MRQNKRKRSDKRGQIIMEFTFSMVIALIMIFGLIMVFRWAGYDFAWRRVDHDQRLMMPVAEDYACPVPTVPVLGCLPVASPQEGPIEQLDPYFHKPAKMNSAWGL